MILNRISGSVESGSVMAVLGPSGMVTHIHKHTHTHKHTHIHIHPHATRWMHVAGTAPPPVRDWDVPVYNLRDQLWALISICLLLTTHRQSVNTVLFIRKTINKIPHNSFLESPHKVQISSLRIVLLPIKSVHLSVCLSGIGKSTLLNVLSGRLRQYSGRITVNGSPVTKRTRRNIGYVMQDDVFFKKITLRQTLWVRHIFQVFSIKKMV